MFTLEDAHAYNTEFNLFITKNIGKTKNLFVKTPTQPKNNLNLTQLSWGFDKKIRCFANILCYE